MNKGIDVEVIKHSISWTGIPIYTLVMKYPRYIHSELMTHRVFSKNSASSRAIPINKMISNIQEDMVQPIWTLNQAGMQGIILDEDNIKVAFANEAWSSAFNKTLFWVNHLVDFGIHKQNVNRLLEPWMHIKIILTGTDFSNWFELRDHPDAQPEIQKLARLMKDKMEESKPVYLNPGEWHIPFSGNLPDYVTGTATMSDGSKIDVRNDFELKVSVARCARISYNNVDGTESDLSKDMDLFKKLITSKPLHASPAEHQAQVPYPQDYFNGYMSIMHSVLENLEDINKSKLNTHKGKYFSNLQGWIQLRKVLEEQMKNA